MKPMICTGGATALALVLLFCTTAPAVANEADKKKAPEKPTTRRIPMKTRSKAMKKAATPTPAPMKTATQAMKATKVSKKIFKK